MNNGNNKRLAAQSSNVVGILSRRVIREVPALKFFDEESHAASNTKPRRNETVAQGGSSNAATKPFNSAAGASPMPRVTPKGVCYTLDAQGCRCIKMQSGALQSAKTGSGNNGRVDGSKKPEEITMEKAMARSLHRKCVCRSLSLLVVLS